MAAASGTDAPQPALKSNRYRKRVMRGQSDDFDKHREISRLRQELSELQEVGQLIHDVLDEVVATKGTAGEVFEKISQRVNPKYSPENICKMMKTMDAERVVAGKLP